MARKMLNFDKVQKDYLNAVLKNDRTWFAATDGDVSYLCNSNLIAFIPSELCGVNCTHADHNKITAESFKKYETDFSPEDNGILEDRGFVMKKDKGSVHVLHAPDGSEIWINEKYYRYFSDIAGVVWRGAGAKKPVYAFFVDRMVGMVLPINHT